MNRFLKFLLSLSTVAMTTILPIAANDGHEAVAAVLPAWSVIPFIGMLLSIAIIPLTHPHWWEKNMHVAAGIWSLAFIIPFAFAYGFSEAWFRFLESMLLDYVPFIVLLFGLFVAAGGIAVRGTLPGTPKVNMLILFPNIKNWSIVFDQMCIFRFRLHCGDIVHHHRNEDSNENRN